ncbi:MAG TPA: DEAD/DEAH box helicase [Polyangia bacterium]
MTRTAPPASPAAATAAAHDLAPALTPHGRLYLAPADDALPLDPAVATRLAAAFERGSGHGLLQLGAAEVQTVLPPVFGYWRDLGARFVTAVCGLPDVEELRAQAQVPPLPDGEAEALALAAPPMVGGEYVTAAVLAALWTAIDCAFRAAIAAHPGTVQEYLARQHPAWHLVGRVHFNLAENRKDEAAPFAFLATYTTRLTAHGKAQHLPLGQALKEYAGAASKERLLSLLLPVQRAAAQCPWLRAMVDAAEIFHPLRWSPADAVRFLRDLPTLEAAGVVVRVPAQWRARRPPRPQVTATVGGQPPSRLGTDALLDFELSVTLEGARLGAAEIKQLLAGTDGLALVRGQWVEVDRERLQRMLDEMRAAQAAARAEGLTFAEALRLLAGARVTAGDDAERVDADWARVTAGPWLATTLAGLRRPAALDRIDPGPLLQATLRPYQQAGLRWLHLLASLGLGACLADDMGLGKTLQALALLLALKQSGAGPTASLLVAPASLLANWVAEIERFAPSLRALVAHPSVTPAAELKTPDAGRLDATDLVITSYATLLRLPWLAARRWRLAILDEAQAIKNPGAKQTRAAKGLKADARIVLTGTPVENRLGDLWSIFDFLNPGLLGSSKEFTAFTKRLAARPHNPYAPLRDLVRPYILRRLKTDRAVIADLPDKTEVKAYCPLSRKQAALYQQAVKELAAQLESAAGMQRRGTVLAFLMRLKQICNHPSQWLGDGAWAPGDSGKLGRLREIAETIAARQEKVLVFTQFREVTAPLAAFLGGVFGRPGLVLHGETEVRKRQGLVRQFQEDETVPFFVLSLKAGGSGLNLTAASHVVHFDRWWNPAVENQATDRAFRIGQTKNVLVHKFVCRGTVEDKIDQLIESKRQLSQDLLEGGAELLLTEMKDAELLTLVALDLHAAAEEN